MSGLSVFQPTSSTREAFAGGKSFGDADLSEKFVAVVRFAGYCGRLVRGRYLLKEGADRLIEGRAKLRELFGE